MNYENYYNKVVDVNAEYQHIKIDGYIGRWSAFQKVKIKGNTYYIFEHDYCGDGTCYLVGYLVVRYGMISYTKPGIVEVYETYDGLIQCLIDEDII